MISPDHILTLEEHTGHNMRFQQHPGALGNGLKWVEWAKVGLIAYPMQNYMRNMIGTLFLMCCGLTISKLRFLDGSPSWDFRLVGHQVWREIQIQFRDLMIPITYIKKATFSTSYLALDDF